MPNGSACDPFEPGRDKGETDPDGRFCVRLREGTFDVEVIVAKDVYAACRSAADRADASSAAVNLVFAALACRWNAQLLAVLGDGAACDVDAVGLEGFDELVVIQRVLLVLPVDDGL